MLPLPADRRAGARRKAELLLERAGDALARGVRAVSGRGHRPEPGPADAPDAGTAPPPPAAADAGATPPPPEAADAADAGPIPPPPEATDAAGAHAGPAAGEDAAARIDAARARLRARIVPPADD